METTQGTAVVAVTLRGYGIDWSAWQTPLDEIDTGASEARYAELVEAEITRHYPGAEVSWERGSGIGGGVSVELADGSYSGNPIDPSPTTDAIAEHVGGIAEDVQIGDSDEWVVEAERAGA